MINSAASDIRAISKVANRRSGTRHQSPSASGWSPSKSLAALAAFIPVAIGLVVLGSFSRPADKSEVCPGSDTLRQMQPLEVQHQPGAAANLAESELAQPGLCLRLRDPLIRRWAADEYEHILTLAQPGDEQSAAKAVALLAEVEQKANVYGLPKDDRISARQVEIEAVNRQEWRLADVAWTLSYKEGQGGDTAIDDRYAILRNEGHALAFGDFGARRQEGALLLATAAAISSKFDLGRMEACADLQQLGYPDCHQVPYNSADPLLSQQAG